MAYDVNELDAAAEESYKKAMAHGNDRAAAIDLALARLGAQYPGATELELRSLLAQVLSAECAGDG